MTVVGDRCKDLGEIGLHKLTERPSMLFEGKVLLKVDDHYVLRT